ncbi:Acetophenone carboxylase gamma subunit [Rhodobacteraceae bacterium SB2]|nr:Acetophenone carboxylase gamma subunit [Rhodobacteraceae bacterium SB2]
MAQHSVRLGVDIGGTFTDVVLEVGTAVFSAKVLTTYTAPEEAIIAGLQQVCDKAGVAPFQIEQVIHGTTLATNALIERRGAKTALITSEGFRDVIEMRTESRFEQYDLNLILPEPLLPRQRRYTVPGRMDANGAEIMALSRADIEPVIAQIAAAGYESVAVGLIHSYLNDRHEKMVAELLSERLPHVMVSLSCEVSPQMREYERFNTVVANAYIKPLMKSYLDRLRNRLRSEMVECDVFLMHSGGGIISLESAAEFPVRLVESGPAGGAVFAAHIAARHGLKNVISFDMGGTTAKICLIKDQTPKTSRVFEVARSYRFKKGSGMPISIPVIDMVEIGAGGGSLAHVDALRQIRVGPQSAGSEPGPACFGKGGEKPAVTDADLLLGKLDPERFAGGSLPLDGAEAQKVLGRVLGAPLNMPAITAAFGLAEVVDENMANAARVHAVETGEDLSGYTMIAFGGAAPLHAGRLCEKLGIRRALVPPGAGVGSAIGFLRAPFSFEATRSVYMKLTQFDPKRIKSLLHDLQMEAVGFVARCTSNSPIVLEFKAYMRYAGQGWEIPIGLDAYCAKTPDAAVFESRFTDQYAKLFGRPVAGLDIEVTVWSVNAATTPDAVARVPESAARVHALAPANRTLFEPAVEAFVEAAEIPRDHLRCEDVIAGPAAITEDETTIIVPSSRVATCLADGCIDLRLKGASDA